MFSKLLLNISTETWAVKPERYKGCVVNVRWKIYNHAVLTTAKMATGINHNEGCLRNRPQRRWTSEPSSATVASETDPNNGSLRNHPQRRHPPEPSQKNMESIHWAWWQSPLTVVFWLGFTPVSFRFQTEVISVSCLFTWNTRKRKWKPIIKQCHPACE